MSLLDHDAKSGLKKKRRTSEVRTRVGGFRKYETTSNSAGKLPVGKNASLAQSKVAFLGALYTLTSCHRCRNTHDIKSYLASKPKDIVFPTADSLTNSPPFVKKSDGDDSMADADMPSVDWTAKCPAFETLGECKHGLKCRFLGGHVRKGEDGQLSLIVNEEKKATAVSTETEVNFVGPEALKQIRTKKV